MRPLFPGAFLLSGGLTQASAEQRIAAGDADAVVFGSAYLANPDLAERFALDAPLNTPQRKAFYSDGPVDYADYPALPQPLNRALQLQAYGGTESLHVDLVAVPEPAAGEVLVRVRAAGINALDWKIREGFAKDAFPLPLPATLGIELAGKVVKIGAGVDAACFGPGTRVFVVLGGLRAYADFIVVAADKLALIPEGLDAVTAAALQVAALTAWQSLFEAGALQAGQTVLVHGAAVAIERSRTNRAPGKTVMRMSE